MTCCASESVLPNDGLISFLNDSARQGIIVRYFLAGGAIERVRLLPDVERAGERLPGAARQHQDRLSQGARQGKAQDGLQTLFSFIIQEL